MWDRGEGDTVESQSLLAISYIKTHGTQYSEENTQKYDRNDDTRLYCNSTSRSSAACDKRCQYESTMGAHCSCSAYTPLLRRSRLRCETGVRLPDVKDHHWFWGTIDFHSIFFPTMEVNGALEQPGYKLSTKYLPVWKCNLFLQTET